MNGFDRGGPDEGRGVFVPRVEELGDGEFKVRDAAKGATSYGFGDEFAEPTFHQVEPTGTGGEVRE